MNLHIYINRRKRQWAATLVWLAVAALSPHTSLSAQTTDSTRVFTEEHPLVYEDAWDLWPYSFLNENGEAVGYNIDLLKMIFRELNIPYIIRLKPTQSALNDLKTGHADLMCGMDAHFHNDYAQYGQTVIQIFTHSVLHRKDEPATIKNLADLARHRVMVHEGSFSHHLMKQKGWGYNAIPYDDMQEAVQKAHNTSGSQIVWNTLSLKFLIHKFQFNDLELTPVDIPHGEYKFMSNNPQLLHKLDSAYSRLNSEGLLQPIQNKWFYPEHKDTGIPTWIWKAIAIVVIILLGVLTYLIIYHLREKRMTRKVRRSNARLALVLRASHVYVWQYNIYNNTVTTFDKEGRHEVSSLSSKFYDYEIVAEDFVRLRKALTLQTAQQSKRQVLYMKATDCTNGKVLDFVITISVLHYDIDGRPTVLVGSFRDITQEKLRQQKAKDNMLRYHSIFDSAMVDTVAYDEHGVITDINKKASAAFPQNKQALIDSHITIQTVTGLEDLDLKALDTMHMTQIYKSPDDTRILNRLLKRPELYYELQIVPVRDAQGHLQAIFGAGRNVTEMVKSYSQLQRNNQLLQHANQEMSDYIRNIDYVLQNGGVRMVDYSPVTHTIVLYSAIGQYQYKLTQTRSLSLTAEESKKAAQRILNSMDNHTHSTQRAAIKTTLRVKGRPLYLYFSFVPEFNEKGDVVNYFGMCRDISEIKATEELVAAESVKAQEVEAVKNAFLRNMSYEIRTPLTSVVGFAELFQMEHNTSDEAVFIEEIKRNSAHLLKLINDILFLSRLDARMIEIKPTPVDFATIFDGRCEMAWSNDKLPGVKYITDNPYNKLVVDIDVQNLGVIIDQILANAVQHTKQGMVRVRYDYTGEGLVLAFQDSGCGIPKDMLDHIFDRFITSSSHGTGLGLAICHELVQQMGGRITIRSEKDRGTIVWVTIPCNSSEIERKIN